MLFNAYSSHPIKAPPCRPSHFLVRAKATFVCAVTDPTDCGHGVSVHKSHQTSTHYLTHCDALLAHTKRQTPFPQLGSCPSQFLSNHVYSLRNLVQTQSLICYFFRKMSSTKWKPLTNVPEGKPLPEEEVEFILIGAGSPFV